jgi:hypothetical protein
VRRPCRLGARQPGRRLPTNDRVLADELHDEKKKSDSIRMEAITNDPNQKKPIDVKLEGRGLDGGRRKAYNFIRGVLEVRLLESPQEPRRQPTRSRCCWGCYSGIPRSLSIRFQMDQ